MDRIKEIRLYDQSMLFYWWPVWVVGFLIGLITFLDGVTFVHSDDGAAIQLLRGSAPGILYISLLLFTVFMTSVRMKGVIPIALLVFVIAAFLTLAWMGTLNVLIDVIPRISVHVTTGFYLVSASALLLLWVLVVFGTDRLSYWRLKEGQLTRVRLLGANGLSVNMSNLNFEIQSTDLLRHLIFGFGSGDIRIRSCIGEQVSIEIQNVLSAHNKLKAIQGLIAHTAVIENDTTVCISPVAAENTGETSETPQAPTPE